MPAPRKGAAVNPPTGDPQGPGRGASGSETSTCPPGSSPRGRTAVSTPSPEPRPRGSRSPALGAPRVCFGWGPERRTKRAGVRPPRGTLPARQSPRQHRAGRSLALANTEDTFRSHLNRRRRCKSRAATGERPVGPGTGARGALRGPGTRAWDRGAGRGRHRGARGHAQGDGRVPCPEGAGGSASVDGCQPTRPGPAATGRSCPVMPLSAAPERRPPARPSEASGGACSPARPRPTPPSWWQWPAPATPWSCPRTEDARLVTAPQRPAPADGTSQGHRAGPGDSGSRAAPSPPGTPWSLDVPVRDSGQQRCAPASCRPAGPPPGSSGAAPAPARRQGPRAREAPRRRAPLPPETPPRREPPAAHGPTGESPRLPRSSSFLRISKQRLWPRALGARPASLGPPHPSPPPRAGPGPPTSCPRIPQATRPTAPALTGSVRAALQPAPSEGRPIVTQGGCPVEATPRGLGSVQAAPPDPSSPSHAPLRAGPAWQLGGPGSLGTVPRAGKARGRKSGR